MARSPENMICEMVLGRVLLSLMRQIASLRAQRTAQLKEVCILPQCKTDWSV